MNPADQTSSALACPEDNGDAAHSPDLLRPRRSNFRRRVPHPSPSPFLSLFPFSVSLPFSSPCLVPEELQQATIGGDEAANRLSEFLLQQAPTDLNRIQVLEAGLARQKVSSWRFLDLSTPSEFHLLLAVEEAPADVVMQDAPARSQVPQEELSRGSDPNAHWLVCGCRMRRAFRGVRAVDLFLFACLLIL